MPRYEASVNIKYPIFANDSTTALKRAIACIYEDLRDDNLDIEISEVAEDVQE